MIPFKPHLNARRYRMPWGAAVGAVASYALNEVGGKDKNGGAGTQTNTKEPWLLAQPWIQSNMAQGQALQDKYTKQPFSAEQEAAMRNQYAQSDYMRGLVPGLLAQMQGQQLGFDPKNPDARPSAWNWNTSGTGGGLLGQESLLNPRAQAVAEEPASEFTQYGWKDPLAAFMYGGLKNNNAPGSDQYLQQGVTGGYGSFKYGMPAPAKGTKEYRDMQEFFLMGGIDGANLYGKGPTAERMIDPNSEWYDANAAAAARAKINQGGGA